jgi:hypothetical protein
MYVMTSFEIINGIKYEIQPIKGGFVRSVEEVNEYQAIYQDYFKNDYSEPITLLVHYKVPITEHVKHKY